MPGQMLSLLLHWQVPSKLLVCYRIFHIGVPQPDLLLFVHHRAGEPCNLEDPCGCTTNVHLCSWGVRAGTSCLEGLPAVRCKNKDCAAELPTYHHLCSIQRVEEGPQRCHDCARATSGLRWLSSGEMSRPLVYERTMQCICL